MTRPPFKMLPSRRARARWARDGRKTSRAGRASYVWEWSVLAVLACGNVDGETVEVALDDGSRFVWHRITMNPEEALEALREWYDGRESGAYRYALQFSRRPA